MTEKRELRDRRLNGNERLGGTRTGRLRNGRNSKTWTESQETDGIAEEENISRQERRMKQESKLGWDITP